ncbi:MAG: MBL fold metallo-hydrolase [Solirubrobacteraceae bacterium]
MPQLMDMQTVIGGVRASAPEPLPFAPTLDIRAFLLERDAGNIVIYTTRGLELDAAQVDRQYLNHRHEASFAAASLDAPLFVHEAERDSVSRRTRVRGTFSRRHVFGDDLEVIPTPGHTPGATAFLWDSGEHRALFTGDTIYLDQGEWVAAVLEGSSDRAAYIASLELIRELDFDVLVPWAAGHHDPFYAVTSRASAQRRIDAIIARLRRGENR